MGRLFEVLKKGLQEILAHKEGKITLKSEFIEIPKRIRHKKRRSPKRAPL